jgi:hypothetical protein
MIEFDSEADWFAAIGYNPADEPRFRIDDETTCAFPWCAPLGNLQGARLPFRRTALFNKTGKEIDVFSKQYTIARSRIVERLGNTLNERAEWSEFPKTLDQGLIND